MKPTRFLMIAVVAALVATVAGCGPRTAQVDRVGSSPLPPPASPVGNAAPAARPPMVPPPGPRLSGDVAPVGYQLTLEVDPGQPSFRGEVTIDLALASATAQLWLDARDLEIDQATLEVEGQVTPLAVTTVADRELIGLDLGRPVQGPARLTVAYRGLVIADDVAGLFRQRVAGAWYLFSQFEAMHARRAVPCFDEPRWKVPWQVTLVVPPGLVAASNAPEAERVTRPDGRVAFRFAPTPPMVSYLLAIAVGPFDIVDVGPVGRGAVPARLLVPAGRAADAAVAAAETPRVVAALEAFFDRPLPLAKLDSVAVPSFPGAMENLGLVTYASEYLVASPARPPSDLRREYLAIAAHELAHQWFGNLVSLTWWDDLWLNESFATWLASRVLVDLDPRRDLLTDRRRSRAEAMARDRRPRAPAVRRVVATSAEADAAFDPLAYDKGATVLAMFERAMGPDRFRDLVRGFITAHAGASATADEFAAELAAGGPELAAGLTSFLDQPGVPRVELTLDCTGAPTAVAAVTRALPVGATAAVAASWRFPLCVRFPDPSHAGTIVERCGWVDGSVGLVELGTRTCPRWLVGDAGGAGYYQVTYAPALATALLARLGEVPVVDRGTLAEGVIAELSGGRTDLATALAWAERLLAAPDRHDTITAVEVLDSIADQLGADARPRWRAWLRTHLGARARGAGLKGKVGETAAAAAARRSLLELVGVVGGEPAVIAQGEAAARGWLDGHGALRGDDLALALRLAAAGTDLALFGRLRTALGATTDHATRHMLIDALAAATAPAQVEHAVEAAFTDPLDAFELVDLLGELLASPAAQDRAWAALVQSPATLASRLPAAAWPLLAARTEHLCTPAQRAEVAAIFEPRARTDQPVALALADALEAIDDCVLRRASHAAGVRAALGGP